jgi:hypothetical protein
MLIKLDAGYGYRWALGDDFHAFAVEAEFGIESSRWAGGGRVGLEVGRTRAGLRFEAVSFGPGFEWKFGSRFRLGVSPTVGIFVIERASQSGDAFWTFTLGAHLDLGVDLLRRSSGAALFLAGRLGYEFFGAVTGLSDSAVATRLWVGYRF